MAVVAFTALAAACSSGKGRSTPTTTTATSTTTTVTRSTTTTTTSTTLAPTTTTVATPPASIAVWPTVASARRFHDPVAAARSFAVDYLAMVAPIVGPFRAGDAHSGEVPVRSSARSPVTTVIVRQLGADASWWVLGAATPNIRLTQPAALATITSPLRVRGLSTAFEATVNLSVRQDGDVRPLAETFAMGGATGNLAPFDTTVRYRTPTQPYGGLIVYTISSETGHTLEATVIRVRFGN